MRSILSVLLITFVFVVSPAIAQKRNITEKDLFNFNWIGDPQISPDGSRVAFVRVTVNDKKDGYNTSIWTVIASHRRNASTDKRHARLIAALVARWQVSRLCSRH